MKVFISWSGETSHLVALVLREWLPSVIQAVEPYVSSVDIDKGARWGTDISVELQKSLFGILCITSENIDAPWINFEAGALSKTVDNSRVVPFLFDIKRSDIKSGPLVQFQSTLCEHDDILQMLRSVNSSLDTQQLDEAHLTRIFEVWWPQLETRLGNLQSKSTDAQPDGTKKAKASNSEKSAEILEEILDVSRQTNRILNSPSLLIPPEYIETIIDRTSISRSFVNETSLAFEDLFRRWDVMKKQMERYSDEHVPKLLIDNLMDEVSGPMEYIARRYEAEMRRPIRKRV